MNKIVLNDSWNFPPDQTPEHVGVIRVVSREDGFQEVLIMCETNSTGSSFSNTMSLSLEDAKILRRLLDEWIGDWDKAEAHVAANRQA
jgi:hypothetical protein